MEAITKRTIAKSIPTRIFAPHCTSLSVSHFSACHCLASSRRHSPYSSVDRERYTSLVKSVMSSRVSSQTPETLQAEDEHMYGPVVRTKPKSQSQDLQQGKLFHSALEDILMSGSTWKDKSLSEAPKYPSEVLGYMESISHILEDISAVRAIESTVQHDTLNYLGIVDCVARYRGVLCIIDWKTSDKPKPFLSNTYDNPIQVAAYAGALNSDENYKYQVENGLIVVAYKDGTPAHAHQLSSELMLEYWKTWLLRLEEFREQR
uniref:Mitochondrial genome maintenance exonuclease 1 n=1 Tax=Mastacembelus armatus TaxID=205130 RepID=A0A7N8Y8D0_9TELE